jgi:hypothetical protein
LPEFPSAPTSRLTSRKNSLFAAQKSFFDHFNICFGAKIS